MDLCVNSDIFFFLFQAADKQKNEEKVIEKEEPKPVIVSDTNSPLLVLLAFLQTLVNRKSELRILIDKDKQTLKAIVLNPASKFTDLVSNCRSIIVAGGQIKVVCRVFDHE